MIDTLTEAIDWIEWSHSKVLKRERAGFFFKEENGKNSKQKKETVEMRERMKTRVRPCSQSGNA